MRPVSNFSLNTTFQAVRLDEIVTYFNQSCADVAFGFGDGQNEVVDWIVWMSWWFGRNFWCTICLTGVHIFRLTAPDGRPLFFGVVEVKVVPSTAAAGWKTWESCGATTLTRAYILDFMGFNLPCRMAQRAISSLCKLARSTSSSVSSSESSSCPCPILRRRVVIAVILLV